MGFKMVAMTFRLVVGVVCVTWRRGSSAHWGWGSSSRWILCGSSSDARSCCCRGNRPSALWSHHLETHRKPSSPERAHTHLGAQQLLPWLPAVKARPPLGRVRRVQPEPGASELLQGHHGPRHDPHLDLRPHLPMGPGLSQSTWGGRERGEGVMKITEED